MHPIYTETAPQAIGAYSQAICHNNIVYLSGQIPLDPKTMQLCSNDIAPQIHQVIQNLSAVCEAAGGSLSHIVRLSIYLTDLAHFPLVNELMTQYFSKPYPARSTIGVAALPKNAQVEIDAIMHTPKQVKE